MQKYDLGLPFPYIDSSQRKNKTGHQVKMEKKKRFLYLLFKGAQQEAIRNQW